MKLYIYSIFIILLACSVQVIGVEKPFIKIAKFKNDALAAVSLTFDDGVPSQVEKAVPILDRHGIPATFFIHTDNVKSTWSCTWDAWRTVVESGHEVGSHTKSHPSLSDLSNKRRMRDEIEGSASYIEQNIGVRPISFAYPFSDVNDVIRRKVRDVYFIDRGSCRMWGGGDFTAAEGIENVEQAVEKGLWFFSMMHGVDDKSFRPIPEKAFVEIVAYLAENEDRIWTDTYSNIGLYNKERILADIKFKDVSEGAFMMRLDIPEDARFRKYMNIPLTLKVPLDGRDMSFVKVYSDDREIDVRPSRNEGYFLVDIVPDSKWIQVYWGK